MKTDGRVARSPLKGTAGDAFRAVLCGCGHNIRLILAHLQALFVEFLRRILAAIAAQTPAQATTEHPIAIAA